VRWGFYADRTWVMLTEMVPSHEYGRSLYGETEDLDALGAGKHGM
jgi:hypothetical protein